MKSKFSFVQTVLIPGYLLLFTIGLGGGLALAAMVAPNASGKDSVVLLIASSIFMLMALLSVRHYLRLLRTIELTLTGITVRSVFKETTILWSDVERIDLTRKEPETFMFITMPMEAISILTRDESKEVFFVKLYSNMDRIRTALHFIKLKLEKQEEITSECFIPVERKRVHITDMSGFQKFSGNHVITLNGVAVYCCIGFGLWLFASYDNKLPLLGRVAVLLGMLLFGPGFFGYQLHYFLLDNEYLVVKNHIWPWRRHVYALSDLREIVFELPHRMSTSLRVITNNYETTLYPAGSLREPRWSELKDQLIARGIKVRDEAYIE
jgi:hypothetical protein